ncbi:MAG: dTDP-4-dehydrorhamnose reductase [Gammaproteobacteria bacterium]|nr:dTDP-4-dehydrorhamnose reductase [Gammaproteobacteria bacterium]
MKILVTGSQGQVGQEISDRANREDVPILNLNKNQLDITNLSQVKTVFNQNQDIAIVVNAAAYTAVDRAENESEKAYIINRDGVKNLAWVCKKQNIPLLHISTDYVFSGNSQKPYTENDPPDPINVYGQSKLAGDQALQSIWEKHVILRVSWVFGQYGQNFVKAILKLAKEREELNIVGDQFGCPTSASDIARVLLIMAKKIAEGHAKWGIYNYCENPLTNWYDFANTIINIAKRKHALRLKKLNKITTDQYPTQAKRPKYSVLSTQKIFQDYGIIQHDWKYDLEKILEGGANVL